MSGEESYHTGVPTRAIHDAYLDMQRAQYDAYQLGLRQLDDWKTEFRTTQTSIGGFLGAQTEVETERVRVEMPKLKRAAREMGDVAEKLGALSSFDESESRTEITKELIEDVNTWRESNLNET